VEQKPEEAKHPFWLENFHMDLRRYGECFKRFVSTAEWPLSKSEMLVL